MKHNLHTLTAHLSLILGAAFLILLLIEWLFPFLHFIESTPGHWLLLLLCLTTVISHLPHGHKCRKKPANRA